MAGDTRRGPVAMLDRFITRHFRHRGCLDEGMEQLNQLMGLTSTDSTPLIPAEQWSHVPTADLARTIFYAPDMDGQSDPGEVVWATLAVSRGASREAKAEARAVLIIGRHRHTLLTLIISSNDEHADEPNWVPIGAGPWNESGLNSWIRLDKILKVPESLIQRRGVAMPRRRFDRIAARLREDYGWN